MAETFFLCGTLRGHSDMVTAITVPSDSQARVASSSRDKSVIIWNLDPIAMSSNGLDREGERESTVLGTPLHRLTGHSHSVQDVVLSSDSMSALSCSLDGELRLWDLMAGATMRRFVGHNKDVLSVAFNFNNCQIVSASRDCTFKLWNSLGECKHTIQEADAHNGWVSCVRFFPNLRAPLIVSGTQDNTVKVWNLTDCKLRYTLIGHSGSVNDVAVSPDGSLCASGGKYGVTQLWDLEEGKHICSLDVGAIIHALCFCPNRYWLCVATENSVQIWDLESKHILQDLKPEQSPSENQMSYCTSLNWSIDGNTFFTGYSDGTIRVWGVKIGSSKDFIINNLETNLHEANGSDDTCVRCQGEYDAEDYIGTIDCGDWLLLKNICPMCKKAA